jgi:iron complex transport system substrate-binding protein
MAHPFQNNACRIPSMLTRRGFIGALACLAASTKVPAQQKPRRIVSTAPSITEACFALGLGDQVVGVSRFCDFPSQVLTLPKVGTYLKPDAEAIARLTPDLVILQRTSSELTERLNALHIPFIEVPHGTLEDVFTGINLIAKAAAVSERSSGVIDRIRTSLSAIQAKAKTMPSPRVLVIVDRRQGMLSDLTVIGPDNYMNQILEIAGGINALGKPGLPKYPRISLETVVRENPDVILDLSGNQESEAERAAAKSATLGLWAQHQELAAVKSGHVLWGTSNALLVPGPRAPEAAQKLFDYMHGHAS